MVFSGGGPHGLASADRWLWLFFNPEAIIRNYRMEATLDCRSACRYGGFSDESCLF